MFSFLPSSYQSLLAKPKPLEPTCALQQGPSKEISSDSRWNAPKLMEAFGHILSSSPTGSADSALHLEEEKEQVLEIPERSPARLQRPGHSSVLDLFPSPPRSPPRINLQRSQTVGTRNPRSRNTFKPNRATNKTTSNWQLRKFAEATLGSGSLRKAVKLPEGEDINEWLAVNVVDFYNQINLLYGSITEFCSPQTCPEMKATDEFEYLWQDNEKYKRPTKMPAPEYIENLMSWCQANMDNEQLFPSRIGVHFPKAFPPLIRQMFKRLYRVYAHIYCHHYPVIVQLGLEPHLNTSFKHYVLFIDEHQLASGKDFWGPLGELVDSMLRSD